MSDVIVVGGGVIGLSIAWKLAEQGARVQLIEQTQVGREASWAGAGMLPPASLDIATDPLARLRALSHPLWPDWSAQIRSETGIDNGFRPCGALELAYSETELQQTELQLQKEGAEYHLLTASERKAQFPAVSPEIPYTLFLPEMSQVRNPRHLRGLVALCHRHGVEIIEGEPVVGFETVGGKVTGVRTSRSEYQAERICLTTGAWSKQIGSLLGLNVPVRPVRGQIVLLRHQPLPFTSILQHREQYLVPRPDGRILIGATMEEVGFLKANTVSGISNLLEFAAQTVPALSGADVERTWAGLRPGSPDNIPFLGQTSEWDNVYYAFGHFRDGLQLSMGTALVMSQLLLDQETSLDLAPYALERP
ncbi:Hydrogen cyanide synthase subunit HcnC precursor [Polystyrenella longa]|uniref:Hydrogen cyanide synthase subunit HcnC n=1 Tax=Polystyrenella longa TaxID=2528007 RepID=A0A518CKI5_9PLAN|nr:glycine oxidase ThiO [Polystyrenella longa]QDU79740.1 Hydrogen cyanide synthase subunit HcnC precursor [Polystyrenella longa]